MLQSSRRYKNKTILLDIRSTSNLIVRQISALNFYYYLSLEMRMFDLYPMIWHDFRPAAAPEGAPCLKVKVGDRPPAEEAADLRRAYGAPDAPTLRLDAAEGPHCVTLWYGGSFLRYFHRVGVVWVYLRSPDGGESGCTPSPPHSEKGPALFDGWSGCTRPSSGRGSCRIIRRRNPPAA